METDPICRSAARFSTVAAHLRERNWRFFSARQRHGKRRYWHLIAQVRRREYPPLLQSFPTETFVSVSTSQPTKAPFCLQAHKALRGISSDYFVFLPDDDRLCTDFFDRAIKVCGAIRLTTLPTDGSPCPVSFPVDVC